MAITNGTLATKINALIDFWNGFRTEYQNWLGGTVGGGPNLDGEYELTDYTGDSSMVKCPAQLQDDVDNVVTGAAAHKTAAETAETNAETAQTAAELAEVNAETAETGSVVAKDASVVAQIAAESAMAVAIAQAGNTSADAIATAADAVATAADAVSTAADAVSTDADATAAAASAAAAAASAASIDYTWASITGTPTTLAGYGITDGGGDGGTVIGDINLATPPIAAAFTGRVRIWDADETDVAAEWGYDGDGAGVVQSLYMRNFVTNGMSIFENDNFTGTQTETLRLYGGRGSSAGQEAYAMANRLICNYTGTFTISDDDPPLMVTAGAGEDGQTAAFLGMWYNNIQSFTASAAAGNSLGINAQGGAVSIGNVTGSGSLGGVTLGHDKFWQAKTDNGRWLVSDVSSTNPSGGTVGGDSSIEIVSHGSLSIAWLGARASDDVAYLGHAIHGQPWQIEGQNSAGTNRNMMTLHPDTGVSINIPDSATEAFRSATQANGLLEVNTDGAGTWAAVIAEGDARLSDARTPSVHNHAASDTTSGTFVDGRLPTDFVRYITATYDSAEITVASSAPGTPSKGDIWFDTT